MKGGGQVRRHSDIGGAHGQGTPLAVGHLAQRQTRNIARSLTRVVDFGATIGMWGGKGIADSPMACCPHVRLGPRFDGVWGVELFHCRGQKELRIASCEDRCQHSFRAVAAAGCGKHRNLE
eukprot:3522366-Amphidinium_carterae.1